MALQKKLNNSEVNITDMYALKLSFLWRAFKKEHICLWTLCIYFFFEYVRPQSLYPVLDILPWAQVFLLLTLVTMFSDKTVRWTRNVETTWLILFTLVLVLSAVLAFRPAASISYWEVFGGWFLVYFLLINVVNTEKRLLLFLLAYCLFSLKMSQHGAVGWASRGFSFASYGLIGAPGWFRNSGEYAVQMLIYGSLSIALVIGLKDYWGATKKWFFYLAAATGYMAVMGSSSRGAQIALAAMGIWMLLKQRNGFKSIVIIAAIGTLLFYILPEEQIQRFTEIGEDRNSLQRLAYWEFALTDVIPKHPILGIGYHNWGAYIWHVHPNGMGPMQFNQESHNIFIQATSELGYIGLFMFLMLILFAFINNARTRKIAQALNNKFLFSLSYGLDAGLIGFLVAGMFVTILYYPFFWIQIAMIVATNSVANRLSERQHERPSVPEISEASGRENSHVI